MKNKVTLKVGNRSYRGRVAKLTAENVESFYDLYTNVFGNTVDEFAHKYGLDPVDITSRFGNGQYKFTSSYCGFKICWIEFMGNTYKGSLSDFDYELKMLNHNRMQIHQIAALNSAVNILNNQGLNPIAKMIKEALFTNSIVQDIRNTHFNAIRDRNIMLRNNK